MLSAEKKQNLEFLQFQYIYFKRVGINIANLKGARLISNYRRFIFLAICFVYVEYGLISFVACHGFEGIDMTSKSLSMFNQGFLTIVKMAIFVYKGDKFMKLIWDINELAKKANDQEKKKWINENSRTKFMIKAYSNICWASLTCAGTFPLIRIAYDLKYNHIFVHHLPFGGKFPYEDKYVILFIINYILSIAFSLTMQIFAVAIDVLYGWYIYSISAHFHIVRKKVERAAQKLENGDSSTFTRDIGLVVSYHNRILEFVDALNDLFGEMLLCEILLRCFQMCFIIYIMNNDTNKINMPHNISCIFVVVMQLVIYCFGGEKIKNESYMLSSDLYLQFPWHSMSTQEKKFMLLPLMRSQRLAVLSAIFFEADRNLIVYIFKTAMSFNAFLSAMNE